MFVFLGGGLFGFFFGFGLFESFGAVVNVVDETDDEENDEGDDEKVNDVLEEVAIGYGGGTGSAEEVGDGDAEFGKVNAAGDEGNDGHDDIFDERVDD